MLAQERIKDFAFIDKTKSVVDEKKSKPKEGLFIFKDGCKHKYKVKTGTGKLAPYWYHWIRNDPDRISVVKIIKGYEYVTKDDDIVPEGVLTNAEGHYQYGDLVLMKCSLEGYLKRRLRSRQRSDAQLDATKRKFKQSLKEAAGGAEMSDELLEQLLEGKLS